MTPKVRGIAAIARMMRSKGWTVESIAPLYRVSRADVLAILRPIRRGRRS